MKTDFPGTEKLLTNGINSPVRIPASPLSAGRIPAHYHQVKDNGRGILNQY
jgi:hypothetical protein